jgi:imidazolonepropionase-like amidohydrolase
MKTSLGLAAVAAALLAACANPPPATVASSGTVLRNVTVVDTRTGALAKDMALWIQDGTIRQVLPASALQAASGVQVVDGGGQYVVPGYLDMHTHALPGAVLQKAPVWPLFLANGVTGIREMAGAPPFFAAARQMNAARAAGKLDAPEVLQVAGVPVGGARTAADGVAAVQQAKAMGASFVKVVAAGPEAERTILREAKAQGLDVAGHLSPGMSAVDTVQAGWKAIEHMGGGWSIQLDCADAQASIRMDIVAGKGAMPPYPFPPEFAVSPFRFTAGDAPLIQRLMDSYNPGRCEGVAETVAKSGTWQVPTLIRLQTMLQSDSATFRHDPNLQYVSPTTRALWEKLAREFTALQPASSPETLRNYYGSFVTMLKLLRQHGGAGKVLAGTDYGGIWVVPGFSLHQEFRLLASAGFTPLEVLQSTTLNGARFLGRESTMGTVEAGKHADLVLLERNPLADVANLDAIGGVFNAGKYFSRDDLARMKQAAAAGYAREPLRDASTVLDPTHRD